MNLEVLEKELKNLNIDVDEKKMNQLHQYYLMLVKYNKVMNLTGITEEEEAYLKHFYDSATLTKIIDLKKEQTLCDVGTGAGFPGLVLKILFPELEITLIDSLNKRILFLNQVIEQLNLDKIKTVHARIEDYAKLNREKFDIVTSRAVTHLSPLLEISVAMVKEGKYCIPMKGFIKEELEESKNAIQELKLDLIEKQEFDLPIENSHRTILKFRKLQKTSKKYPRKYSEIKKKRL